MITLYNGGKTQELVSWIEEKAAEKELTLSRWQANRGSHATTITYALHTGERASQFRHQPAGTVTEFVKFDGLEGATERCAAYKALVKLASSLE